MSEVSSAGPTDERPPFRFSLRMRTDFADTDLAGIVYYGRFSHLCDRAVVAYRRQLGLALLGPAGHVLVLKAFECDFLASLLFDEPTEIFVRTSQVGRTSHTVRYRVEGDGGRHAADITQTFVGLERYGGKPSPIPPDMRG
ncbi:MAG: acyl-CoA thioesterase, partial [Thermoleophilia bacterium]|nr:acyl-CoA thioesterase [Thermoleophilia bacterium]